MKLYRIEVTSWPTPDDYPWHRFVHIDEAEPWLLELHEQGKLAEYERHQSSDYSGNVLIGWVLPATHKRHYLSRAAAHAWVAKATSLGAVATAVESEPIIWKASA